MRKKRKKMNTVLCAFMLALVLLACTAALWLVPKVLYPALYPQKYADVVHRYAAEYALEENVLYAVIRTESGFDAAAQSKVDARGLMQITEETFAWIKSKIAPQEDISFEDMYNAETNIRFGAYFFSACLQRYNGDLKTAAAAYHSGWGTVDELLQNSTFSADGKILQNFPYTQMNLYTKKVEKSYNKYNQIYK